MEPPSLFIEPDTFVLLQNPEVDTLEDRDFRIPWFLFHFHSPLLTFFSISLNKITAAIKFGDLEKFTPLATSSKLETELHVQDPVSF